MNILRKPSNTGPGQTRQYGIDRTDCEYMIFLDADDCFYSPNAVSTLLSNIKDTDFDVVASCFLEELLDKSTVLYSNEINWMHGKLYRTQYIKNNNIKFNKTRSNEDTSFNAIIYFNGAKIKFIDMVTYIWRCNKNSISRAENFIIDSMDDFITNAEYVVKECFRLKVDENNIFHCIMQYLCSFYGYYIIFLNEQQKKEKVSNYISSIKRFNKIIPNNMFKLFNDNNISQIFYGNGIVKDLINNNIMMNISFYNFINSLKSNIIL